MDPNQITFVTDHARERLHSRFGVSFPSHPDALLFVRRLVARCNNLNDHNSQSNGWHCRNKYVNVVLSEDKATVRTVLFGSEWIQHSPNKRKRYIKDVMHECERLNPDFCKSPTP